MQLDRTVLVCRWFQSNPKVVHMEKVLSATLDKYNGLVGAIGAFARHCDMCAENCADTNRAAWLQRGVILARAADELKATWSND